MMCSGILLGALGGFVAARLVGRHSCGHHGWHRGHHGWRGRGRFGGAGSLFFMLRELDLDREQRRSAWQATEGVRKAIHELRDERFDVIDGLIGAASADTFDRATAERAVGQGGAKIDRVRAEVLAAVEKLHGILTSEQRARLREMMAARDGAGPEGGPYRTANL